MIIKWKCNSCGALNESNTHQRHKMDWCACGKSAVDAEEDYTRIAGDVEILEE
jgi:hypothetical protein